MGASAISSTQIRPTEVRLIRLSLYLDRTFPLTLLPSLLLRLNFNVSAQWKSERNHFTFDLGLVLS